MVQLVEAERSSVVESDISPITHVLHRLYRVVAGRSRSQRVPCGMKCLL
jgi:hypothetical protein